MTGDDNHSVLSHQWTDDPRWLLYIQDDNGDPPGSCARVQTPTAPLRGNSHLFNRDCLNNGGSGLGLTRRA